MKLKTKISLGYLSLLVLLLVIGIYSINNINTLDKAASNILKDNLHTLQLGKRMLNALNKMQAAGQQLVFTNVSADVQYLIIKENSEVFENNLRQQQENITESGEGELVNDITEAYSKYKSLLLRESLTSGMYVAELVPRYQMLHDQLNQLISMNMDALVRKSDRAQSTARHARLYTLLAITLAVVLGAGFMLTVPAALAKPIDRLIESIQAASEKDFSKKLPVHGQDELSRVAKAYNVMLKRLKEFEFSNLSELLTAKKRTELIVQNLDEGILLLDQNLRVTEANPTACRLLGVARPQLVGRLSQELENENELYRELVKEIMIGKTSDNHTVAITDNGEETFYHKSLLEIVSYNELNERSEFSGYVITLRNISDYKRLDQTKSNFLATVSHELRTPLAAIGYSLKLLQDERIGKINAEQKHILHTLKQETSRLQKLAGELIDVSQLESGNIQLNIQQVNIGQIIHYVEDIISIQLLPKRLRLQVMLEDQQAEVLADVDKTAWVLLNLLSNAVRHSPEGDEITVSTVKMDNNLLIKVHDNGPGIAPSDHEKIFTKFLQLNSMTHSGSGSGLGLSISKEFIQSQGGTIWVESELGAGSTFVISLPLIISTSATKTHAAKFA